MYFISRLMRFERFFIESGIRGHIEELEQLKMQSLISSQDNIVSGNPADNDENISAIWFFVQLSMSLYGLAFMIFLVECVLGYRLVDTFVVLKRILNNMNTVDSIRRACHRISGIRNYIK